MRMVKCFAAGALLVVCLSAQTTPAKPQDGGQQKDDSQKTQNSQSLPPGPVGLQPLLGGGAKVDGAANPGARDASAPADPNRMAAPDANTAAGGDPGKAPVDAKVYVIGAEDVIHVLVWNQANLSGDFVVRPDGRFSMPLIGDVQAADRTPEQLGTEIEQKLKDGHYLLEPNVSVGVNQVNSKKYFIDGEVNRPGAYPLVVPTTIMEALVNAGGFRDFANMKNIKILRSGGREILKFNYKDVSKGKHLEQNKLLEPGDHIIIP
jgi:polysaccharide export outer membrane protein